MSDFNSDFESILAEAIERVEAGAMVDAVIVSYPLQYRDELREMLFVVDNVQLLGTEPVPMPSAQRRASAKQDFLAFARELASEDEDVAPAAIETNGRHRFDIPSSTNSQTATDSARDSLSAPNGRVAPAQSFTPRATGPNWFERLADSVSELLTLPVARLAPIAALFLLAILSIGSFYTVAWSVPGDIAYPFKEWTRRVQLDSASPEERAVIVAEQDKERAEELAVAQERVDQQIEEDLAGEGSVDLNDAVLTESLRSIYNGRVDGDLLKLGATDVLPRYQLDANDPNSFAEIEITGGTMADLVEGTVIDVQYQIVPGAEKFVQGVSIAIVNTPVPTPVVPTPVPATPTPTAVVDSAPQQVIVPPTWTATPYPTACVPSPPPGWSSYIVTSGDTFSGIVAESAASATQFAVANCIQNRNRVPLGSQVWVPNVIQPAGNNNQLVEPAQPVAPTALPTAVATATSLLPLGPTATPDFPTSQEGTPIPPLTIQPTDTFVPTATSVPVETPAPAPTESSAIVDLLETPPTTEGSTAVTETVPDAESTDGTATDVADGTDGSDSTGATTAVTDAPTATAVSSITVEATDPLTETLPSTTVPEPVATDASNPTVTATNAITPTAESGGATPDTGDNGEPPEVTLTPTPTFISLPSVESTPSVEANGGTDVETPIAETPIAETPIAETPIVETPSDSETTPTWTPSEPNGGVDVTPEDNPTQVLDTPTPEVPSAEPTALPDSSGESPSNGGSGNPPTTVDGATGGDTAPTLETNGQQTEVPVATATLSAVTATSVLEQPTSTLAAQVATNTPVPEAPTTGALATEEPTTVPVEPTPVPPTAAPVEPTPVPPTPAPVEPTPVPPTPVPPTPVPPTPVPPTPVPPTPVPPTPVPPTPVPPTPVPPTPVPPTPVPPTPVPPTPVPPTPVPPTPVPPTPVPPTPVPPTPVPPTPMPPTPTPV